MRSDNTDWANVVFISMFALVGMIGIIFFLILGFEAAGILGASGAALMLLAAVGIGYAVENEYIP